MPSEKTARLLLPVLVCLAVSWPGAVRAAAAPSETRDLAERWADRCTDFTANGWAFKAPANFLDWLEVFSDPAVWLELARRGLDPRTFVRSARSALDPAMVRNYLEWTDPRIQEAWARALAGPDFVTAVNATLFDPGRFMRWAMLPLEPRAWEVLRTAVAPGTLARWLSAPWDPETQALFAQAAAPDTTRKLLEALQDPGNYPDMPYLEPASVPGAPVQPPR